MIKERFIYRQALKLEGFRDQNWYGGLDYRLITDKPVQKQFDEFQDRIISAKGKQYLPVYRMADGEFNFILRNHVVGGQGQGLNPIKPYLKRLRTVFSGYRTCWGEKYDIFEYARAIDILKLSLREVSQRGFLAVYFALRGDKWGENYFEPVCDWFEANKIDLNAGNFIPFYFPYALLNGPRNRDLFEGSRVCVITHLNADRKGKIRSGLLARGVRNVFFYPISKTKAIFDSIDISSIPEKPDLVLVAGGIGSVNILRCLKPLGVPCIDSGIVIECFIDPSWKNIKPFIAMDQG